ncbi:melanoma-associated antigen B16 [Callithrix jacchus]|uniref:MAGE family member B16 n=1 Tax=Callithrix jacchus TaxID=9483 RepID=F7EW71_CALJA|nr:melanoma-associated antigen B16 [Callithrix jacchus]
MSQYQGSPRSTHDQHLQTLSETQSLEVSQVSKAMEKTILSSSHPLVPGNLKEAPAAKTVSSLEGPQSSCSSSIAITATSSGESDEGSSSQEEEEATSDPENMPADALDQKVAFLVNFILQKYQMKEPITKADVMKTKIIIKDDESHLSEIFLRASECLEMIFGLDVKKVDPTACRYGLFIKLGLTYDGMLSGKKGKPKTGLLILVLGAIFIKGNCATEEEVWEVLSLTGVYSGKKHFISGEPRELITKDFVKEEYLEYQQVANSDPAGYEFPWGPRAKAETSKMKVLEFVAKIHGTHPDSYPSQYEEALKDERARAKI